MTDLPSCLPGGTLPLGQLIHEGLTAVDKDLHHQPVRPIVWDEEPELEGRHVPGRTIHRQDAWRPSKVVHRIALPQRYR